MATLFSGPSGQRERHVNHLVGEDSGIHGADGGGNNGMGGAGGSAKTVSYTRAAGEPHMPRQPLLSQHIRLPFAVYADQRDASSASARQPRSHCPSERRFRCSSRHLEGRAVEENTSPHRRNLQSRLRIWRTFFLGTKYCSLLGSAGSCARTGRCARRAASRPPLAAVRADCARIGHIHRARACGGCSTAAHRALGRDVTRHRLATDDAQRVANDCAAAVDRTTPAATSRTYLQRPEVRTLVPFSRRSVKSRLVASAR